MKLILTQEVTGLGGPGDIVEVKDGYGRNFLVPRGLGIKWTRGAEKQVAQIRRGREVREIADRGQAQEVAAQLAALKVLMPSRAGQGGRLFGSVTAADVVDAVKAAGGPALDKRRVELPAAHIKTVGVHTVAVRLHPEVQASIDVEVTAEA
ncbi:MAG: large subunit ribosomal protein [Frankiaceae bacterium]|jgi:large subunit ribosomal protein L9|nr:large subunit ribosomal protein [Frankiaceae bacterium]